MFIEDDDIPQQPVHEADPEKAPSDFAPSDPDKKTGALSATALFARMHPALNHLPIGWLFALFLCETAALSLGQFRMQGAGPYLAVATFLSFVPAMSSGLARLSEIQDVSKIAYAHTHRNFMYCAFILVFLATIVRLRHPNDMPKAERTAYLIALLLACMSLGIGAHVGAKLIYGMHYLPF